MLVIVIKFNWKIEYRDLVATSLMLVIVKYNWKIEYRDLVATSPTVLISGPRSDI